MISAMIPLERRKIMAVRCKIVCTSMTERQGGRNIYDPEQKLNTFVPMLQRTYEFAGVPAGDDPHHENWKYWDATPVFECRMTIVGDEQLFEVGREYYDTFVKVISAKMPLHLIPTGGCCCKWSPVPGSGHMPCCETCVEQCASGR